MGQIKFVSLQLPGRLKRPQIHNALPLLNIVWQAKATNVLDMHIGGF